MKKEVLPEAICVTQDTLAETIFIVDNYLRLMGAIGNFRDDWVSRVQALRKELLDLQNKELLNNKEV